MMIGGHRWPPVKGPILACPRPQCDDDDGAKSSPMIAAFAGKNCPDGSALPQWKRVGSSCCRMSLEDRNTFVLELPRPTRKENQALVVDDCNCENGTFN